MGESTSVERFFRDLNPKTALRRQARRPGVVKRRRKVQSIPFLLATVLLVCGRGKTAGTYQSLLATRPAMRTFVAIEGVEPTNNHAERALRQAVIWRKTHTPQRLGVAVPSVGHGGHQAGCEPQVCCPRT